MPGTPTPNLQLIVPTVGGDSGVWGNELNTDLGIIDTLAIFPVTTLSASSLLNYSSQAFTFVNGVGGSGGITFTLPSTTGHAGKSFVIKKVDSAVGTVVILPFNNGQPIDGNLSWILSNQYQFILMYTDGTQWFVGSSN